VGEVFGDYSEHPFDLLWGFLVLLISEGLKQVFGHMTSVKRLCFDLIQNF
jgi:hypothetical protein